MLDATQKAVQFSQHRQRSDLDEDDMFALAIVRRAGRDKDDKPVQFILI